MGVRWGEFRVVFAEEIRRGSRRAWFRVATLLVPLVLLVSLIAAPIIRGISDEGEAGAAEDDANTGLVDLALMLERDAISESGLRPLSDREAGVDALLKGEVDSLYVIPRDYIASGVVEQLHTRTFIAADFNDSGDIRRVQILLREALVREELDPEVRERFLAPATFESVVLRDDMSVEAGSEEASIFSVSYIFMFLLLISIVSGSMMLLESVTDEKQNRMMEILATSVTPLGVMAGKVFALGALGLVQVLVWAFSLALVGPRILEGFPEMEQLTVDPLLLMWVIAFFLAGYFVMSVVMAAIGAASTSAQEGRQVAWLVLVPTYVPLLFWPLIAEHPNGWVSRALSFIPIDAPATMMLRLGADEVGVLETLASLVVTVAGGVLLLFGAARVFRAGQLMYGQRMSFRGALSALRQAG